MHYKVVVEKNRIAVKEQKSQYKINLEERFLQFAVCYKILIFFAQIKRV